MVNHERKSSGDQSIERSASEGTHRHQPVLCPRQDVQKLGYAVLHEVNWKESIDEMKHADQIVERILFLEGVPNIAGYDKILVGSTVKQQLENNLGLEQAALEVLNPGIHTCLESRDDASRELLEHIVVDEERHIDWIEAQFHQIKEVGYENYLSQQIFKKS